MTTEIYKFPADYFQKRIQTALAAAARIGQPADSFDFVSTSPVIRHLHSAAYDRFLACFPVKCSECGVLLPVNPTSDCFLFCPGCGVYWDLLSRSSETTRKIRSVLRPDGSLYRRPVSDSGQLDLSL